MLKAASPGPLIKVPWIGLEQQTVLAALLFNWATLAHERIAQASFGAKEPLEGIFA